MHQPPKHGACINMPQHRRRNELLEPRLREQASGSLIALGDVFVSTLGHFRRSFRLLLAQTFRRRDGLCCRSFDRGLLLHLRLHRETDATDSRARAQPRACGHDG